MKNMSPPEIVTVPVVTSAPSVSGRRKSPSLKRSLSSRAPQSTTVATIAVPTSSSTPTTPTGGDSSTSSTTSASRTTSVLGPSPASPEPPLAINAGLFRKTDSEREIVVMVPLAAAFLEQVKLEISVTKQHADVRYVLSVQHAKLGTTWQHARSFDEYRKLQQRLLKLLHHGHFCRADCPWMFTFLKSYFPKSLLFNFASARVVAARKAALERFFATAQSFLLNRTNHACGFLSAAVANELVEFIYGDVLKQYALEQLSNTQPSVASSVSGILGLRRALADSSGDSGSDEDDGSYSSCADTICQLCDSSLYGEARASAAATGLSLTERSGRTSSSLSVESRESLELDMVVASLAASVGVKAAVSPTSSSWSSAGSVSGRRNTHYVTTLECGHQFHDECVVPKLNETLCCPTCGHLEIK